MSAPFKLPVRLENGNLLVAADSELITSLPDATHAEMNAIVALMNSGHREPQSPEAIQREGEIREMARDEHQREGEVEIDDNAILSEGDDNGTYVQAWVWVDFAGTKFDKGDE